MLGRWLRPGLPLTQGCGGGRLKCVRGRPRETRGPPRSNGKWRRGSDGVTGPLEPRKEADIEDISNYGTSKKCSWRVGAWTEVE